MSRLLGLAFDRVNALPHAPLLVAAGLVLGAMAIAFRSQAEPYTFDHIELNRRKEETGRPKTEWMNMCVGLVDEHCDVWADFWPSPCSTAKGLLARDRRLPRRLSR